MRLFIIGICWAVGLLLGSQWSIPLTLILLLFTLPLLLFLLTWRYRKSIFYAFYILAFLSGIARMQFFDRPVNEDSLSYYQNQNRTSLQGIVNSEVTGQSRVLRFELGNIKIKLGQEWREVKGNVLVEAPRIHEYKYGDLLYLEGKIKPISKAGDHYLYLEKQGVTSLMSFPRIRLLASSQSSWPKQQLYELRSKLSYSLTAFLPEPQGALAQALLLGLRQEIPRDLNQDFRNTGTTHLIAISGMNISLFAGMVMSLGIWLFGRRHSLYLLFAFLLVWLYTFLAGMNPPVFRAAIMASAYFLAEYLGRPHSAAPALALSALFMTAIDPQALRDVSFQLSFMAMLGLAFLTPIFIRLRENIFPASGSTSEISSFLKATWDMASVSLGAILATLPLTAYYFGIIPLAGLPATFLSSLTLPHIIIVSSLTAIAGLIIAPLAQLFAWVDWLFLSYMILAVKAFAFWPYVLLTKGQIPFAFLSIYYGILIFATGYFINKNRAEEKIVNLFKSFINITKKLPVPGIKFKKLLLLCLLLANFLIWIALFSLPDHFSHIFFLDVGHGDSIFIQTPNSHQVLIDGGPEPYKARLYLGKKMPFWDRSIDMVVLTHPHQDHLEGLKQVLLKYKVDYVLDPQLPVKSYSYEKWREQIKKMETQYFVARDGLAVDLGNNSRLEMLHPPPSLEGISATNIDDNAVVLRFMVGKVSFLLPSDNRERGQRETVLNHPDIWSTVLAAPHHGSAEALVPLFLDAASPSLIVISSGSKPGDSREKTKSKLKERFPDSLILTTAERGSIEFITDGQKLWVRTEK